MDWLVVVIKFTKKVPVILKLNAKRGKNKNCLS